MNTFISNREVIRATVIAKVDFLPSVTTMVRDVADRLGLEEKNAARLELIVEEACLNVIEHAFDSDEIGYYDVIVERLPGKIVVAVEDMGLPFDVKKIEQNSQTGLGMLLMKAFADEIHFKNLGRGGKRVELVKTLPYKGADEIFGNEEGGKAINLPPAPADVSLKFQMMTPDMCMNLARCVYRSYGYTYPNDTIYYPEQRRELMESGLLESCVVLNQDNEIVGHLALIYPRQNASVAESGQAVVDPRYRGRGLFEKMKRFLGDYAKQKGLYGLYSEAVSIHPYTQKGNISLGAGETGFLLGYAPSTMYFKKIQEGKKEDRQTTVLFYFKLNEEPVQKVYAPFHHKTMIENIYKHNNIKRNFMQASKVEQDRLFGDSQINVKAIPDLGLGFMEVLHYGETFEELLQFRLKELCLKKIEVIYLDLPLSNKLTQHFCAAAEKLGFFFAGIVPELYEGDVLRLQYLNNITIDLNKICFASRFGKTLLDYVFKESGF